ncbi:hypothetical protein [Thalassospira tepidiphila]|uniref:hypothetical protein n=1 Tax=Thalassospira tepidiphila TaxID=393657 RepID=UPI003AA7E95E
MTTGRHKIAADPYFDRSCLGNAGEKIMSYRTLICLVLCSCVAVVFGQRSAHAQDTLHEIHWLKADVPPIGIGSGPLAGKGLHGGILDILFGASLDPDMVKGHANMARLFALMKTGNYCVPGLIRTAEREEVVYFSKQPSAVLESSHLVYSPDNRRLREAVDDKVSLAQLLDAGFVVGIGAGISYGEETDRIIQRYSNSDSVVRHPMPNFLAPMLSMIEMKRVDFSLAPPWALTWFLINQKNGLGGDSAPMIVTHPFREASEKINYHVVCTKNAWGKKAVAMIDEVLARDDIRQALARNAQTWLSTTKVQEKVVK